MTSLLEERYRRALRMLPSSYRDAWEDDMVATFMERAYAATPDDPEGVELGMPSRAELASIASLAVRLRLGGVGAAPRYFAWGEAVRRVALVGLLVNAISAILGVGFLVWIAQRLPGLLVPAGWQPGRWEVLWRLVDVLWLAAYLALLYGRSREARIMAWVAFAPLLVVSAAQMTAEHGEFVVSRGYLLLFNSLPVLALAAFHGKAPPVGRRPWLIALPIGSVLLLAVFLADAAGTGVWLLSDPAGLWCAAVTAGAIVALIRPGEMGTPWMLALAVLGGAAFGLRVTTFADYLTHTAPTRQPSLLTVVGLAQSAVVLIATATVAVLATRSVRRLSEAPPGPTAS